MIQESKAKEGGRRGRRKRRRRVALSTVKVEIGVSPNTQ
jgi:hypothetical protein